MDDERDDDELVSVKWREGEDRMIYKTNRHSDIRLRHAMMRCAHALINLRHFHLL